MLNRCTISGGLRTLTLVGAFGSLAMASTTAHAADNRWLGRSTRWDDAANWSRGRVPEASSQDLVAIGPVDTRLYPELTRDVAVGGTLVIRSNARLTLNGHVLEVGDAVARATFGHEPMLPDAGTVALTVEEGAVVNAAMPGGQLRLRAGGLLNRGRVEGGPGLTLAGAVSGFFVDGGESLELSELILESSPYPYTVRLLGNVNVLGDMRLRGGHLRPGPAAETTILGDLCFEGGAFPVMLTPETDVVVHGTIRSDGSVRCIEAVCADPVWDEDEGMGYCVSREDDAWVRLVGGEDRVLQTGGILPPLALDTPGATVRPDGDLHGMGLFIARDVTLDLSDGQELIFGHMQREFARYRPQGGGDPRPGFIRSARDLVNEGTILAEPAATLHFLLNITGNVVRVTCRYRQPGGSSREETPAGIQGAIADRLHASAPWSAPGSLSINRYNSRLMLHPDGRLLLDEKPHDAAGAAADEDVEIDALLDMEGDRRGKEVRAAISGIRKESIEASFSPPPSTDVNIAPRVAKIATPARASTVFAVQGPLWRNRDAFGTVDADPRVGSGGAAFYEYVFAEPVRVGAVRLFSQTSLRDARRFVIFGDTAERGVANQILAQGGGGVPTERESWTVLGESWASFDPVELTRLRLMILGPDERTHGAHVGEFEIYADGDSEQRLAARTDAHMPPVFPEGIALLERQGARGWNGPDSGAEYPVRRVASIAFWMAGISWTEATDPEVHNRLPPLRDHPGVIALLKGIKDLHFDAVTIFFEAESVGFPWPTVNFKSALNARYLVEREAALMIREAMTPETTGDEILDLLEAEAPTEPDSLTDSGLRVQEPEGQFSEVLRIEDLPCRRNLLAEFCEAARERGVEVYVVSRPEDMKLYTGPDDRDPYELFLRECAAAGVDGVSIVPDEQHPLWAVTRSPLWRDFQESTRDDRKTFSPEKEKRWIVERAVTAGKGLGKRMESVRSVNPDVMFYVDGARLGPNGDPYDLIWGAAKPDYVGCSYQSHIVRRWAATTPDRRVVMGSYPHRSVRYNLESVLQGARMVRTYRYNYIDLAGSADYRRRENRFIEQFVRWGGTRPARAPVALLLSRASEAWWPMDARAGRLPGADPDRCWMVEEIVYEFLLKNGYPFDVFYLDRTVDLDALTQYPLVILPFAYSVPRAALAALDSAYTAGANFLVFEREGEVDEFGAPFHPPSLKAFIARGRQARRMASPEVDLVSRETDRAFVSIMREFIDPLLGNDKELELGRFGNRIFATAKTVSPEERYVSIMNWEDRSVRITVGTPLPEGDYQLLTLSSADPEHFREAAIAGKTVVPARMLRNFGIRLDADEVLSLYIIPAGREWGTGVD